MEVFEHVISINSLIILVNLETNLKVYMKATRYLIQIQTQTIELIILIFSWTIFNVYRMLTMESRYVSNNYNVCTFSD